MADEDMTPDPVCDAVESSETVVNEEASSPAAEAKAGDLKSKSTEVAVVGEPESDATAAVTVDDEEREKETCKRKRSLDHLNLTGAQEQNHQRRSTRSHACAQRLEEDIDSLRAELRSYLPTALL